MEPQLEDVVVELTPEAPSVGVLPLSADDLERDVLVRGTHVEPQDREILVLWTYRL